MTRTGQIKVAILVSAAESLVRAGDRILCLTGLDLSGAIDTIMSRDLGKIRSAIERELPGVKAYCFMVVT